MGKVVDLNIRNIKGEFKPLDIFQYFDDGIRQRLPRNLANDILDKLLKNIDRNRYRFQLSPDWVEYKKRVGADDRPFMMFGYYKRAIQVVTSEGHLAIGFKKSTMHPRAKIRMSALAVALEYGDLARNRPARPLWRNTMRDYMNNRTEFNSLTSGSISKNKLIRRPSQ